MFSWRIRIKLYLFYMLTALIRSFNDTQEVIVFAIAFEPNDNRLQQSIGINKRERLVLVALRYLLGFGLWRYKVEEVARLNKAHPTA